MRKHFESGAAFIVVALLCFAAAIAQFASGAKGAGSVMVPVGGFWLIFAMIARGRSARAKHDDDEGRPAS